ncbi:MAG: cysteine desulfurase family protein [Candidatus Woesearchaeota archaeon]
MMPKIKDHKMTIYLDNGATTAVDKNVLEAMLPFFQEKYGNASSIHQLGQDARKVVEEARQKIADALGAEAKEIIFTSGGTESDNLAIKGVARANKEKGNHIITTKIEHPAVLSTCEELEKEGFAVTYLDVDKDGFVSAEELEKAITDKTILVSIIHGNNEIGTVQNIDALGKICKEKGVLFHIDAVQSFTKVTIDVSKINVDLISISAHKIHGPKGVGALYVRKGTKLKPLMQGGGHEFRKRPGTENVPGIVGFAKAAQIAAIVDTSKIAELRDHAFRRIIKEVDNIKINGPRGALRLCNNINISFANVEGEALGSYLDIDRICVSTGSACSSQTLEPSHVLLAIGLSKEIANGTLRMTLSKYTTKEEIDKAVDSLKIHIEKLRAISPLNTVLENVQ